jgi:Na+(H+)/acetate symporter ActP
MKRLVFAYLIGLAACLISVWVANRPNAGHVNFLFAALLGISSTVANVGHQHAASQMTLAAAVLSLLFILAEALRSRDTWTRWLGWGLWALLAVASLFWFRPPNI